MREFDEGWQPAKGEKSFEVTSAHQVDIWVSSSKLVQVLGVPEAAGMAAVVLKTGEEFRFRAPIYGFKKVVVRGTGDTPFGLKFVQAPRQNGEVNSGEKAPVITLPEPSNLVAKMRRMAADHHRYNRMPVLEPEEGEFFGRYEFEDDEEVLFEEEAYAKAMKDREEARKRKAALKAQAESGAEGRKEPEAKDVSRSPEPSKEAASPPKGSDQLPDIKAAE